MLFTYDFPHLKSAMILKELIEKDNLPDLVIAAPSEQLNVYEIEKKSFLDPGLVMRNSVRDLASKLGITYLVAKHNSAETEVFLNELRPTLGIVGGARILPEHVIDKFSIGVLNAHPGLIPQNRGLYTFHYAILRRLPQAVTLHLIDRNVDAGKILNTKIVQIDKNESAACVNKSMLEMQVKMLSDTKMNSQLVEEKTYDPFSHVKNARLTRELEYKAIGEYPMYRSEYSRVLDRYYSGKQH